MGVDGIGSSVIIALAAVMWFLYLVPTWFRRKEYLATERNAVRLQQTMRILAESAELPSVVRVEATARTVAAQQRALRQQQRTAGARAPFARSVASVSDEMQRTVESGARTRRRLRRSRALASLVLVLSFVGVGFGFASAAAGNWLLLTVSIAVGVGSVALLQQAATVTRARAELRRVSMVSVAPAALHDEADYEPRRGTGWTPVAMPKPLYLSQPASVRESRSVERSHSDRESLVVEGSHSDRLEATKPDHAALLRAASAEAESALRSAQDAPNVARISQRPAAEPATAEPPASPSRFASMGVVDPSANTETDLDEILRRRRAVG